MEDFRLIARFTFLVLLLPAFAARGDSGDRPVPADPSLPDFLDTLYARRGQGPATPLEPRYRALCRSLGIPSGSEANRRALQPLLFRHALLTTTDAVDCRHGGILWTTYLWHWTSPNPRHGLRRLPDSTLLAKLPPPPGYGRYKTWADVDRLPSLYLGDLAAEKEGYWHPRCGEVLTFGWCSEREMAASLLWAAGGYRVKIKQEGIHVWSEVLLDLAGPDGRARPSVIALDHTFDTVEGRPLRGTPEAWASDFGSGAQVAWYNRMARSPEEIRKVEAITVSRGASLRIYTQVDAWRGIVER